MTSSLRDRVRAFVLEHGEKGVARLPDAEQAWCALMREVLDTRVRARDVRRLAEILGEYLQVHGELPWAESSQNFHRSEALFFDVYAWGATHIYYDVAPPTAVVCETDLQSDLPTGRRGQAVRRVAGHFTYTEHISLPNIHTSESGLANDLWMEWGARVASLCEDAHKELARAGVERLQDTYLVSSDGDDPHEDAWRAFHQADEESAS